MKRLLKRFVKIGVAVVLLLLAAETLSRVKMSHRTRDSKYLFPQFARAPVNQPVPPVQAAVPAQNYGDQTNLDLTSAFRDAPQAGAKVFTDPIHLGPRDTRSSRRTRRATWRRGNSSAGL